MERNSVLQFIVAVLLLLIYIFCILSCAGINNPKEQLIVDLYITDPEKEISGIIVGYREMEENTVTVIIATSSNALDSLLAENKKKIEDIQIKFYEDSYFKIKNIRGIRIDKDITMVDENSRSYKAITLLNLDIDTSGYSQAKIDEIKRKVEEIYKESIKFAQDFINNYNSDDISQGNLKKNNYISAGYYKKRPESEIINGQNILNVHDTSIAISQTKNEIKTSFQGGGLFFDKNILAVVYSINSQNINGIFFNFLNTYIALPESTPQPELGNIRIKSKDVYAGDNFETDLYIYIGDNKLGEYKIQLYYYGDDEIIQIDTSRGNRGVTARYPVTVEEAGTEEENARYIVISRRGGNTNKTGPDVNLFTIHWKAKAVGTVKLKGKIEYLKNFNYNSRELKEIGIVEVNEKIGSKEKSVIALPTPIPLPEVIQGNPRIWLAKSSEEISKGDIFPLEIYCYQDTQNIQEYAISLNYNNEKITPDYKSGNSGAGDSKDWKVIDVTPEKDSITIRGRYNKVKLNDKVRHHLTTVFFKAIQTGATEIILDTIDMTRNFEGDKKSFIITELPFFIDENNKNRTGYVWGEPQTLLVKKGDPFETKVFVNIGEKALSAYTMEITFDKKISISTDKWYSGIRIGDNGFFDYIQPDNNIGRCIIKGKIDKGVYSENPLHLFTIFWQTMEIGDAIIRINPLSLSDKDNNSINTLNGNPISIKVKNIVSEKIAPIPAPDPGPGEVMFAQEMNAGVEEIFYTDIKINTGIQKITSCKLQITFPPQFLQVNEGEKGLKNIQFGFLKDTIMDNINGNIKMNWSMQSGLGPDKSLHLFRIYWKAIKVGTKEIKLKSTDLIDTDNRTLGKSQDKVCRVIIGPVLKTQSVSEPTPLPSIKRDLYIIEPAEISKIFPGNTLTLYGTFPFDLSNYKAYKAILNASGNQQEIRLDFITDTYLNIEDYWFYTFTCDKKTIGENKLRISVEYNSIPYDSDEITVSVKEKQSIKDYDAYKKLVDNGISEMQACNFFNAVNSFKAAHDIYPDHSDVTLKFAQSEYYCGNIDDAEKILNDIIIFDSISDLYDSHINNYEKDILENKELLQYKIINIKAGMESDNTKKMELYKKAYSYLIFLFNHSDTEKRNIFDNLDNTFLLSISFIIENFVKRDGSGQALSIVNELKSRITEKRIDRNINRKGIGCLNYILNLAKLHFLTGYTSDDINKHIKMIEESQTFVDIDINFDNITIDNIDTCFFYLDYFKFKTDFCKIFNPTEADNANMRFETIKNKLSQYTPLINYLF